MDHGSAAEYYQHVEIVSVDTDDKRRSASETLGKISRYAGMKIGTPTTRPSPSLLFRRVGGGRRRGMLRCC